MLNTKDGSCSDFFLLRLPEVYLNKAEALAMLEKTTEAIETIQTLREQRVKTGTLGDLQLSGEELVNYIRNERRLELTFEGQRWFDLRRYAVCPKWPFQKEIHHPQPTDRVAKSKEHAYCGDTMKSLNFTFFLYPKTKLS